MDPELLKMMNMAAAGFEQFRRGYRLWSPITAVPNFVQPFFALAAVLAVAISMGISLAALSTLIVSLIALQFLLVEIFGFSIEIPAR